MTESWMTWQGKVINGTFALQRLLGQTDHGAVFLTDYPTQASANAAIKIVPAIAATAETQLANWRKAAALPHPHLARILESGQFREEGRPFLYVVTDYAEQSLQEILPHRPLISEEVRAMLLPVLEALAFLHANQLIQGQLKPSNILVIDDQVKLASDTIQPTGAAVPGIARSSLYDAPETASGLRLPAGDMWALGITIVQALTQRVPAWTAGRPQAPVLPPEFPRDFIQVVLRCLQQNPTERPTPQELKAQISGAITAPMTVLPEAVAAVPPEPVAMAPQPPAREDSIDSRKPARIDPVVPQPERADVVSPAVTNPTAAKAVRETPKRPITPLLAGAVVGLLVIWGGARLFHRPRSPPPGTGIEVQPSPPAPHPPLPTAVPAPTPTHVPTPTAVPAPTEPGLPSGVLHQALPTVARSANETIHGHLRVVVRVVVNQSGQVTDEMLEDAGPSKYFARLASTAARNWKFAASDDHGTREWLLRFDFSRDQVSAKAEAAAPTGG